MKKKLFTLLTLLLCVCSGAWADQVTLAPTSASVWEGITINEAGGSATATFSSSYISFSVHKDNTITLTTTSLYDNVSAVEVTFKEESKGDTDMTCKVGSNSAETVESAGSNNAETTKTVNYVTPQSGAVVFSITSGKASSNAKTFSVKSIKITYTTSGGGGAEPTETAKWDWQNNDLSEYNVNAVDGTKDITISGLTMHVCAAVGGTTVKLTDAGNYAQMNQNTEIQVPVQSITDVVTIVSYPGQYNYTVGGVAATANITNHTATMREVAQGYVSIVATETAYIYNVEVKQYAKDTAPALQSFTAGGTTYYADELEWVESPSGTFSTTIFVDALPASITEQVAYVGTANLSSYSAGVATITVTESETTKTYVITFSTAKIITVAAGAGGTVSPSGDQPVASGGNLTITATPNSGYAFLNWTKASDNEWASTTNPLTIEDITASDTYTANFQQLYTVTYAAGSGSFGTTSKVTKTQTAETISNQVTLWNTNYYLSKDGFTLTGWDANGDGIADYALGETVTLTANTTMTAVYTENTVSLTNSQAPTVVSWLFNANPLIHVENATGYYVQQATVNGSTIDVPMYIYNTTATTGYTNYGKFATSAGQVQARRTKITIPAINGMKVVANAKTGNTYIFRNYIKLGDNYPDGSTGSDVATASATYTYSGENGTVDICIYDNDIYLKSIVVTYPVTASEISISTLDGRNYASYVTSSKLDFADESIADDITAYIATGFNGEKNAIVLKKVNVVPAETPIIVYTTTKGATVNVPVTTAEASNVDDNALEAGDNTTAWNGTDGYTYYYLANDQFHKATSGTLKSGKAYLKVLTSEIPDLTRPFSFAFDDDNTTGINAIENGNANIKDAIIYNLNGQRVVNPNKGLYIVNGKKVIMK